MAILEVKIIANDNLIYSNGALIISTRDPQQIAKLDQLVDADQLKHFDDHDPIFTSYILDLERGHALAFTFTGKLTIKTL